MHLSGDGRGLGHVLEAAVVPHGHKVLHVELDRLQRQLRSLRRRARRLACRLLGLRGSSQDGAALSTAYLAGLDSLRSNPVLSQKSTTWASI